MDLVNFNMSVPTWKDGEWSVTEYTDKNDFVDMVQSVFKEPGTMQLDETSEIFNEQARNYNQNGYYCPYPKNTKDFIKYWDFEKQKCRNGVLYIHGEKKWYLPREYYMWINFLPIFDKIKKKFDFPQVWDVQIYIALYELLAELHSRHGVIVKKRQIASSYYHCAKLINSFWFEEGSINKIGASLNEYVSRSWKYMDEYKNFLHSKTAWQRPLNPGKIGEWVQKVEIRKAGKVYSVGLKSMLNGVSFEKSATSGIGGPTSYMFYEEAGIAPTLDKTYIYMKSAMEMGDMTTGFFVAAGSVGELKDCEPLKEFILNPEVNGFYAIENSLYDDKGNKAMTGLFIPEQWGMPPYIDSFGNSMVQEALEALDRRFEDLKKKKDPSSYQLEISQHPRCLTEAFAYRDVSIFPTNIINDQMIRIDENEFPYELVDLEEAADGSIVVKRGKHSPITEWPVKKNEPDKQGAIQVWERPDKEISYNNYIASIDPVKALKTTTSDSLNSIYVYKMPVRVNRRTLDGNINFVEGGKVVCCWAGRFDNPKMNHKRLELILKWYKCKAIVEANVQDFINYMVERNLAQKYLVKKNEMVFLKEFNMNTTAYQEYGWKNTNNFFKTVMLPFLVNFINEVIHEEYDEEGNVISTIYGIRRIPDKMVLKEMLGYSETKNVDRIISLTALVCYLKAQEANHLAPIRYETDENLENNSKMSKLVMSPFTNIGTSSFRKKLSPFGKKRW